MRFGLATLVSAVLLAACARPISAPAVPRPLAAGQILVVPCAVEERHRAVAERAADLLVAALGPGAHVLARRGLLAETSRDLGTKAGQALDRVERGGWPTPEEAESLTRELGSGVLLTTRVSSYDQVWGKYGKFTRVAVDVDVFDLRAGHVIWRMRGWSEVEDERGRAFGHAMEQAVGDVAAAIRPSRGYSLIDIWRSWRR